MAPKSAPAGYADEDCAQQVAAPLVFLLRSSHFWMGKEEEGAPAAR